MIPWRGAVNGVFDLLTPGHLHLLRQAHAWMARECGSFEKVKLYVFINSDESVRKLKGEGRPIYGERHREDLLCALPWVHDCLVYNTENELRKLIRSFRIMRLFKSSEYSGRPVTGTKDVEKIGGRIVWLDHAPGLPTTTEYISAMREAPVKKPSVDEGERW